MTISVITVTYNVEETILHCLDSIRKQSYLPQHIVVDGGSTDDSLKILGQHGLTTMKMISESDTGIYDAMNKGIGMADNDIIGILNADDEYVDSAVLSLVLEAFQDTQIDACYGDLLYVDRNDTSRIVRNWRSGLYDVKKFYWGWMVPHPTLFVRSKVYKQFGGFNTGLGSAADYELMLRFFVKYGIKAAYIPEVLIKMRVGGVSNASFANRLRANRMDRMAWRVNGLQPYPWTLLFKPLRKIPQWLKKGNKPVEE